MTRLGRWLQQLIRAAALVVGTMVNASELPSTLVLHVVFRPSDEGTAISASDKISKRALEVRQAVRVVPTRLGHAVEFAGHPAQGVLLGVLELRPPVTLALWFRRAKAPPSHPDAAMRPEYLQEHRDGWGRILSPLTGTPRDAAQQSGVLRMSPDGVSVWHGPAKWSTVVSLPLPVEEWMHLAVTFGADLTATGYLNGQPRGTTRSDFNLGSGPVAIAAAALDRGFGYPFAGAIGDVRIYRGVLGQREIDELAGLRPDS